MRAAAIQMNSTDDLSANRATADRLVRAAAADGAEFVVLPEKWPGLGTAQVLRATAGQWEANLAWAREIARELGIDLVAGSMPEPVAGEPLSFNTSVHVGPDGAVKATYRKIHMFDVEVEGTTYRESDTEQPGEEAVLSATDGGIEVGLTICYDLRFPELYRMLAVRGARVLTVPSAFTYATTRDHWEILLRARAIENQAFVVAANQIGVHPPTHRSGGRSMIVDPWGLVLASAPDTETHVIADLDLDRQGRIRSELPSLANRRPSAYGWPQEAPA